MESHPRPSDAPRILLLACAVVTLASCSNAAEISPTPGRAATSMIGAANQTLAAGAASKASHALGSPFSGESLTGMRRHVRTACHRGGHGDRGTFSASGVARGPYPGTFTARGQWADGCGPYRWMWSL
jgi:hypothetical protein